MELLENPVQEPEIEQEQQQEENYESLSRSRKIIIFILLGIFMLIYFALAIKVMKHRVEHPVMEHQGVEWPRVSF